MKFYASNENFSDEVEASSLPEAIWKLSVAHSYKFSDEQLKEVHIVDEAGKSRAQVDLAPISYDIFKKLDRLGAVNFEDDFSSQDSAALYQLLAKLEAAQEVWNRDKEELTARYEEELKKIENRVEFNRNQISQITTMAEKRAQASEIAWLYSLSDCSSQVLAPVESASINQIHVCIDLLDGDEACRTVWRHSKTFGTSIASCLDEVFSHPVEIQCWRFESLNVDKVYLRLESGLVEFSFPVGFKFKSFGQQLLPMTGNQASQGADFGVFLQGLFDRHDIFRGKLKINLFQNKFAPAIRFFSYGYEPSAFADLPTVEDSVTSKSRGYDTVFHQLGKVFGRIKGNAFLFQKEGESTKQELSSSSLPIAIDQISKDKLLALAFNPQMQMHNANRNFDALRDMIRIKSMEAELSKAAVSRLIEVLGCKDSLAAILSIEREIDTLKTRLINLGQIFPNQDFIPTENQLEQIKRRYLARFNKRAQEKGATEQKQKRTRIRTESKKMKKLQKKQENRKN